uniref:LuxR C-terminal-related transcriptional regulator n=1 Tax=Desertihabitans aurantiacus TaxID=2282477 RepID=UPI0022B7F7E0
RVHGALAAATDAAAEPDRFAWHRGRSVQGTDEGAAAELERSAGRARSRGGFAASAAFLQQAVELTPDPADRARRALEAAHDKQQAGASEAAQELLDVAEGGPLDPAQEVRTRLLRAQIAFALRRGGDEPDLLVDAARAMAPIDPAMSRDIHLHALDAAMIDDAAAASRIAATAADAPPAPVPPRFSDLLLDALAVTLTEGFEQGVPGLQEVARTLRDACADPDRTGEYEPWLLLAGRIAVGVLDDELAFDLAEEHVRVARAAGSLAGLPAALSLLSNVLVLGGQLTRAGEVAGEAVAISESIGVVPLRHAQVILASWRGDRALASELYAVTTRDTRYPDDGAEAGSGGYAMAVLHNGLGDYPTALEAAGRAEKSPELSLSTAVLPELVEAAARSGDTRRAGAALERLSARARACGTSWALGLEARSRALTSSGARAEELHREAVARLEESRMGAEAARAHLLHGEWLRREGRRAESREVLRTAHRRLSEMGAEAFAARAARELRATGEHPRGRTAQPADELTAQELHIARLVATGATSREVAAQLFLSPRTIEAHLRNIFRKLGITSRRQLRALDLP